MKQTQKNKVTCKNKKAYSISKQILPALVLSLSANTLSFSSFANGPDAPTRTGHSIQIKGEKIFFSQCNELLGQDTPFKPFTTQVREILLERAEGVALEFQNADITEFHVALALFESRSPFIEPLVRAHKLQTSQVVQALRNEIAKLPKNLEPGASPFVSADLTNVLGLALKMNEEIFPHDAFVNLEAILVALLNTPETSVSKTLKEIGFKQAETIEAAKENRSGFLVATKAPEETFKLTEGAIKDLSDLAQRGILSEIIGRDKEVKEIKETLLNRDRPYALLVGPDGVGKSSIIRGLVHDLIKAPESSRLGRTRVVELKVGELLRGAESDLQAVQMVDAIAKELAGQTDPLVVVLDGINQFQFSSTLNLSTILAPLQQVEGIRIIATATPTQYQAAQEHLDRIFIRHRIEQPTEAEALEILRALRPAYESEHRVQISDEALKKLASYANRHYKDYALPESAVRLLSQTAAHVELEAASPSKRMLLMQRDRFQENLIGLRQGHERQSENIQTLTQKMETFQRAGSHDDAAAIRFGQIPEAEKKLATIETQITEAQRRIDQISAELENFVERLAPLTLDHVSIVVERLTGIPVGQLAADSRENLRRAPEFLGERVIGQKKAVESVALSYQVAKEGFKLGNGPLANFLFFGPTGVGKTEMAKALTELALGDPKAMLRLDMTEFKEAHSISRLTGTSAGYVGYEDGAQLTDHVRENPYTVILLDEIEKAHPNFWELMMQVLDEGHLTDAKGNKVDFSNTIIVMTSNIGVEEIPNLKELSQEEQAKAISKMLVDGGMKPEVQNRIDKKLMFDYLGEEELVKIANLFLEPLLVRASEKNISVDITKSAIQAMARYGMDDLSGARLLRSFIYNDVAGELAKLSLSRARGDEAAEIKIDYSLGSFSYKGRILD
jgi:ATP-dependent Clp protease ATP-binding subunit ClpB